MADPVTQNLPTDATADMLASQGATITPAPQGSGDATADMLAANGATPSQSAQPKRSALKSMLLNFAEGMGKSLQYQAGVPQFEEAQAQAKIKQAQAPYAGQQAQATLANTQAETQMQQELLKPVTIQVPGPNGTMVDKTVAGWQAKFLAPQTTRYLVNQDNINSREGIANDKLDASLLALGYKRTKDADGNYQLTPVPKDQQSDILKKKGALPENEATWIAKAQAGDPVAKQKLDMLNQSRASLAYARGAGFGKGKADNSPFTVFDENGNLTTVSVSEAIKGGYPPAQVWNTVFGPTGSTKSQGQAAGAVAEHLPDFKVAVENLAKKGELGAVAGRINTYLTQGYGGDDPDISNFVTTVGLLKSGAVRAHFGAKGGQQILATFDKYLNTAQEPKALLGSADAIGSFLKTYKDVARANPNATGGTASAPTSKSSPSGIAMKPGDVEDGHVYLGGNKADPKSWRKQ